MQPYRRQASGVRWQWSESRQDYYYFDATTNQYILRGNTQGVTGPAASSSGRQPTNPGSSRSQVPRTVGCVQPSSHSAVSQSPEGRNSQSSNSTGNNMSGPVNAGRPAAPAQRSTPRSVVDSVQRYRLTVEIVESFLREVFPNAPAFNIQVI